METIIVLITCTNILFFFIHELDAVKQGEWRMFKLPSSISDDKQYQIFLWAHVPLFALLLYYAYSTFMFSNYHLWIGINIFSVIHLILHLTADKFTTNVFNNKSSYIIISIIGLTGAINLLLFGYYPIT